MCYVYILKGLKTGEFYKGITNNLNRRLTEHLTGNSFSTRSMIPLKLVHVEICKDRKDARLLEKYYKSGSGRETLKYFAEVVKW